MKIRSLQLSLILFLFAAPAYSQIQAESYAISTTELKEWINYLSSDDMK